MINSVQYLRVFAAWMVVFHHFVQLYFHSTTNDWFVAFFTKYGAYGVDLFFIVSGFVIYHSTADKPGDPKQFILQRLVRIAPAYWLFTAIIAILLITCEGLIPLTAFQATFFFKSLLFLPEKNPSGIGFYPLLTIGWTLNYEMVFYLIFALTLYLPLRLRFVTTAIGFLFMVFLFAKIGGSFSFYSNKIMLEFLLGMFISLLWRRKLVQRIHYFVAAGLFLLALLLIGFQEAGHHYLRIGIPCALIFTAVISQDRWFNNSWIVNLGNWSYSTYLCHLLVLASFRPISITLDLHPLVILCFCCPLIIAISYLSYSFIEKPVQRYFKLLQGRRREMFHSQEDRNFSISQISTKVT